MSRIKMYVFPLMIRLGFFPFIFLSAGDIARAVVKRKQNYERYAEGGRRFIGYSTASFENQFKLPSGHQSTLEGLGAGKQRIVLESVLLIAGETCDRVEFFFCTTPACFQPVLRKEIRDTVREFNLFVCDLGHEI